VRGLRPSLACVAHVPAWHLSVQQLDAQMNATALLSRGGIDILSAAYLVKVIIDNARDENASSLQS
jgi:hypothetical protein